MPQSKGFAAQNPQSPLAPFNFARRDPGPTEIAVEILFCGVCHSDLHMARNEWGNAIYPMVPGHEIVGRVVATGNSSKKFKLGELAAIGVIIDSCRHCAPCGRGEEHFCVEGATLTYAVKDRVDGSITMGGYSNNYVVDERFAHTIPENLDLAAVAPLLCAGITTYSPLRHWNAGPGKKVGISASADSATWASSSRTPSAPMPSSSPHLSKRRMTPSNSVPMRSSSPLTKTR